MMSNKTESIQKVGLVVQGKCECESMSCEHSIKQEMCRVVSKPLFQVELFGFSYVCCDECINTVNKVLRS